MLPGISPHLPQRILFDFSFAFHSFPMIQFRQIFLKISPRLLRRPILIRHMLHEEIRKLFKARVDKITVVVAPFAVFLVERTVRLTAGYFVLERHTAALADVPARRAEKRIDGDVKERRQALERFRVGERFAGIT